MNQADHSPTLRANETPELDHEFVSASLMGPNQVRGNRKNDFLAYTEPEFENSSENPYRDTTESDINIRYIPLADLIPRPWKTFEQIMIASYISVILFFVTGLLAVRYARRGKRRQTKGLMGMAQKDLRLSVWFIYASVGFGILIFLIIVLMIASV